ncbi:universal stress protein [Flavobacterium sp. HBTb2-11-1]|uniref:universal stress protein n=1 Tax=Flavobacterium sp. HBTb2-11-1 TaxID=2692212 RepID=UPI00136F6BA6|nr:universal stress protein [Flavobacterium sp. HBTb2-11-1]MXO06716.1 hypothetical protein [Flavobacterium sp. HBTb2-11-1]
MKKILVTTDLSQNSKTAVRFAIQLASQTPYELVFYHADTSFAIDPFSAVTFATLRAADNKELMKFVNTLYKQTGKISGKISFITESRLDVSSAIIECAAKVKADYICIGTRGGGLINKLLGTHASRILNDSPIPIFVVPRHYRTKTISSVFYPSDIENFSHEIQLVKKISSLFDARISVYHYNYFKNEQDIKNKLNSIEDKYKSERIVFYFKKLPAEQSLHRSIQIDIIVTKPSLIVMFAKEDRTWFEQLLQPLKSSEKGFDTRTPMLVFRKE